jgi:hypothetical protein
MPVVIKKTPTLELVYYINNYLINFLFSLLIESDVNLRVFESKTERQLLTQTQLQNASL